jgi:hypothetical protein
MDTLFDHLEVAREAVSILNGKHTHWVGRGQPEECAAALPSTSRTFARICVGLCRRPQPSNSESFAELLGPGVTARGFG